MTAPGDPFQLGAVPRPDESGTNFAIASSEAESVTLCLFDGADGSGKETRHELDDYDAGVWHGFIPGVGPGHAYGYRVGGPWDPASGQRFNPNKLLLDPYARAYHGQVRYGPQVQGHDAANPDGPSTLDSATQVPRSLVIDASAYDWEGDTPLTRPVADTVIYEIHVKGFTARHPDIPRELRGTYAGLAHDAATGYLKDLGVTAVELLPVHHYVPEQFLIDRGLTN